MPLWLASCWRRRGTPLLVFPLAALWRCGLARMLHCMACRGVYLMNANFCDDFTPAARPGRADSTASATEMFSCLLGQGRQKTCANRLESSLTAASLMFVNASSGASELMKSRLQCGRPRAVDARALETIFVYTDASYCREDRGSRWRCRRSSCFISGPEYCVVRFPA